MARNRVGKESRHAPQRPDQHVLAASIVKQGSGIGEVDIVGEGDSVVGDF